MKIVVDTSDVQAALSRITQSISTIPWIEVGEVLETAINTNFIAGGRYDSGSPVDEPTGGPSKWEPRVNEDRLRHPVLIKTGKLKQSIFILEQDKGVDLVNRTDYGPHHQYGTKKMPRRPFFVVQDGDIDNVEKRIDNHIQAGIDKK